MLLRRAGLEDGIHQAGAQGPLAFVLVGAGLCAVGVPRQVVAYAGGLAFGALGGTGLALLAEVAGAAVSFGWAGTLARPWAMRMLARRQGGRLARLRARLLHQPFTTTLTLRLLPVGNSLLLSLLAGVAGLPAVPFLLASAIGFLPQTLVFALIGRGVQVDAGVQVGLGLVLLAVSVAGGIVLMRRVPAELAGD